MRGFVKPKYAYLNVLLVALFCLSTSGCMTWKSRGIELLNVAPLPPKIRLTLGNGGKVVLRMPALSADTLKGNADGRPVGFLRQTVVDIQVRRVSWSRTSILAAVLATPSVLLAYLRRCDCSHPAS
jgi:hypothetical protein